MLAVQVHPMSGAARAGREAESTLGRSQARTRVLPMNGEAFITSTPVIVTGRGKPGFVLSWVPSVDTA